jgi:hypothetical protein
MVMLILSNLQIKGIAIYRKLKGKYNNLSTENKML